MSVYESLSLFLDAYISVILTIEYFWGRSDRDIHNEAKKKRKFREKYKFDRLTEGEAK